MYKNGAPVRDALMKGWYNNMCSKHLIPPYVQAVLHVAAWCDGLVIICDYGIISMGADVRD